MPPDHPEDNATPTTLRALALTLTALAVGVAIHLRDGEYMYPGGPFYPAIWCVGGGLLAAALAVRPPGFVRLSEGLRSGELALGVVMAAVVTQFVFLLRSPPGGWNWWSDDLSVGPPAARQPYYVGVTAAAFLTLVLLACRRRFWLVPFLGILAAHAYLGAWMVRSAPEPRIDVWTFQQFGARALLDGQNPYAIEFPNVYADQARGGDDRKVYGDRLVHGDTLGFGFPYPPVSLYLSTAGYAAGGDYRYAHVAGLTLAGLLLALARPGRWGAVAAVLLLFTPRAFFVLGRGWTEPSVVFLLALTVFCACRLPRLLPVALGLFLASKQYLIFAVPLAWLLVPNPRDWRRAGRLIGLAVVVAVLVTAPLALRDPRAFFTSTVTAQLEAPFRTDALSWLVWAYERTGVQPGAWVAFALATLAVVACLRYCPRTPAGFATALAATYLPFIAFNKQAFANYYLFAIGAAVCGLGLLRPEVGPPVDVQPPDTSE